METPSNEELRAKAEHARDMYRSGQMTREEAKAIIEPYLEACNEKAKELAKKYNVKARKVGGFSSYVR